MFNQMPIAAVACNGKRSCVQMQHCRLPVCAQGHANCAQAAYHKVTMRLDPAFNALWILQVDDGKQQAWPAVPLLKSALLSCSW